MFLQSVNTYILALPCLSLSVVDVFTLNLLDDERVRIDISVLDDSLFGMGFSCLACTHILTLRLLFFDWFLLYFVSI